MFFVLPIKINRTFKSFPYATIILILINVIVYFGTAADLTNITQIFGFTFSKYAWFSWFTSLFLHGSFFHLLWNMYFLWLFGSLLEDVLGKLGYLSIYFSGGLFACLLHSVMVSLFISSLSDLPLIGASGAIAALLGVFAIRFYKNKITMAYFILFFFFIRWGTFAISSLAGLSLWLGRELLAGLIQLLGEVSNIANWAHIGGFIFGMVLAKFVNLEDEATLEYLSEEAAHWGKLGLHSGAISRYEEILKKDPSNLDVLRNLAKSYALANLKEKAISNYQKVFEVMLKLNQREEASKAYEDFYLQYPDYVFDPKLQFLLASLCDGKGKLDLALDAYLKLIKSYPQSLEAEKALLRMGDVYLKKGNVLEAIEAYEKFIQSYPASEWYSLVEEKLKNLKNP